MWSAVIKKINRFVENLTAVFLAAMVILIFVQIISRELVGNSFPWTEEVARYLMIWITFLGASFAFQYGGHIGIDFVKMKLPHSLQKLFDLISLLACSVFFYFMIKYGFDISNKAMIQTSAALNIPMGYVYLIIPISGCLMLLNMVDITVKNLKKQSESDVKQL